MPFVEVPPYTCSQGILIRGSASSIGNLGVRTILEQFKMVDLTPCVESETLQADGICTFRMWLRKDTAQQWAPNFNTLTLCENLHLDSSQNVEDLTREIFVAMLIGPVAFEYPSLQELQSAVRIRCNVVAAGRKTSLAFQTAEAERPADCWIDDEDYGFIVRPEVSLVTALKKATQPEYSGHVYSFSCYRASEYVILLGIAQELQHCNPDLKRQLQAFWTRRPIKSGEFHEVFLREQGSMEAPLPPFYFVPGDRTWFRNPDEASADASGFEGSWVMYLGGGLFTNFWKHDQPYTLDDKCLEIYHWRDGLYRDAEGDERIDEAKVAQHVAQTLQDPAEVARILRLMQRYREPRGVYTDAGGCLDTTREFARWVCAETTDLVLPRD
jgi:hypothetical protein